MFNFTSEIKTSLKTMDKVMTDIWPILLGSIFSAITLYVGFINKMRSQISVLEEKVKRVEQRQDSHSKKNDEIIKLITDLKVEVIQKLGQVATDMSKLSSDVDNINRTFVVFDSGIKKDKNR